MKVTYEANDGTKFDSEQECLDYELGKIDNKNEQWDQLYDLFYDNRLTDSRTSANLARFCIDNKDKFGEILGFKDNEVIYNSPEHGELKSVKEYDGCQGCLFNREFGCNDACAFYSCATHKIIWIKK